MARVRDSFDDLEHIVRPIEGLVGGSQVVYLDRGNLITDEDQAMLMALYSRSPDSVMTLLGKLAQTGSANFMDKFYVGYGHGSIGDCGGGLPIFIEGVSMLAAKAIQDNPLYRGQERSTRYQDYTTVPFLDPTGRSEFAEIFDMQREFYAKNLELLKVDLKKRYPMINGEKESIYENAIGARAFDILRGFLPAGATTNVAWATDIRQARDHLQRLRNNPLEEVRKIASVTKEVLQQANPNSFNQKEYPETERFVREMQEISPFLSPRRRLWLDANQFDANDSSLLDLRDYKRPNSHTLLPRYLGQAGVFKINFDLDFGSFRDIQRQRSANIRMPLLSANADFCQWYLNELPLEIRKDAVALIGATEMKLARTEASNFERQYATMMGYEVPVKMTADLPSLVYILELRTGSTVHPTLRKPMIEIAARLREVLPNLDLFTDDSESRFDIKRGTETIFDK